MYQLSCINWKKIALVDMLSEPTKLFSELTKKTILKYKKLWKKILFVVGKKWYNTSYMCEDCGYIPKCDYCDVPIGRYVVNDKTVHMCPICRRLYDNVFQCKKCGWFNIKEMWIWTYKLQEILQKEFWLPSLVVENTQVNTVNKIKKLMPELLKAQIVISTPILSYPVGYQDDCKDKNKDDNSRWYLDDVKNNNWDSKVDTCRNFNKQWTWFGFTPDIVIFPNADTGLSIPDFNVAEKHFLFLYEYLKNYSTQNFIIQTFNFNHYVYQSLLKMDLEKFWKHELYYRKLLNYPPYTYLAVLIYKHQVEEKLYLKISKIESELKYLIEKFDSQIEMFPTPQLVFKKFWKYHYNIILKWPHLKSFLDKANSLLKLQQEGFQIDWMPSNLV